MRKLQSLAFTALLCAIHIIIIFVSQYVPFLDLVMVFFLPIFSAILAIKCDYKYSFILFVSTMLIGILIDPTATLLYIMSPLVFGIGYGILVKNKVKTTTMVYILTILSMGLLLIDTKILSGLLNQDFINILCNAFHIDTFYGETYKVYLIFLVFGFAQAFVTHFTLKFILKKMNITLEQNKYPPLFLLICVLINIFYAIYFRRTNYKIIASTICAIFFAFPFIVHGYRKNKAIVPLLISQAVIFLAICIPCVKVLDDQLKLLIFALVLVPPVLYAIYRIYSERNLVPVENINTNTKPKTNNKKKHKKHK